jgi:hypothetical protein
MRAPDQRRHFIPGTRCLEWVTHPAPGILDERTDILLSQRIASTRRRTLPRSRNGIDSAIHRMRLFVKAAFLRLGYLLPPMLAETLQKPARAIFTGLWLRKHRLYPQISLQTREQIFDLIGKDVADRKVLYLEFGVYKGDSIKYWSSLLKHPEAMLHGFDSFEGLPQDWHGDLAKGFFSTGGEVPNIADRRVRFVKGWFSETLPRDVIPPHEVMVINMDANLYS